MEGRRRQVSGSSWTGRRRSGRVRSGGRSILAAAVASTPLNWRGGVGRPWASTTSPRAINAANRKAVDGATFVVGDVTDLLRADLGMFDFFFDVGCFQGLSTKQRLAEGRGVSALASPGATLLMLAFGPTRIRSIVGGVSRADVEAAFPGWEMLSVEPAETRGLGWPLTKTAPQWYRLRRQG